MTKIYRDDIPDISELFQAYFDCRKNKRNSDQALEYELDFEDRLFDLYERLINQTYQPGQYIFFVLTDPKPREVWASQFEDRVVHHLLYNRLFRRFVNSFIHDSYSCIPGKGTHRAVDRLDHFVRSATNNYQTPCYYLQCDVESFYMSINKHIMFDVLCRKIQDPWWKWLTHTILFSDPKENYILNSPRWKLDLIPRHKSLFSRPSHIGVPIGNLPSQFDANIYLNELDQFAKHHLKLKHYIRYADDIVILHPDPQHLNICYDQMNKFLSDQLALNFHPKKKILQLTERGINFVGYIVKHNRKYMRKRTVNNFKNKDYNNMDNPTSTINSYFGFFKHANCYNLKLKSANTFLSKYKFSKDFAKAIK